MTSFDLQGLLGLQPSSDLLKQYINSLTSLSDSSNPAAPDVKAYSDVVYFNYFALGLSLHFTPTGGYKPKTGLKRTDLKDDSLVLDSIDFYNVPRRDPADPKSNATSSRRAELAFSTFPSFPITLNLVAEVRNKEGEVVPRPSQFQVLAESTGKDFVNTLGEPDRKGGGAGPSSGSIGIWCEWSKDGIMVEFGGDEAVGPQAWERGKDAAWKLITVFRPDSGP